MPSDTSRLDSLEVMVKAIHDAVVGTVAAPGLAEKHRTLDDRVGRLEDGGKRQVSAYTAIGLSAVGAAIAQGFNYVRDHLMK